MRYSTNEFEAGALKNGYDYNHQCWIINFLIQPCGHPKELNCHCFGKINAGIDIKWFSKE